MGLSGLDTIQAQRLLRKPFAFVHIIAAVGAVLLVNVERVCADETEILDCDHR